MPSLFCMLSKAIRTKRVKAQSTSNPNLECVKPASRGHEEPLQRGFQPHEAALYLYLIADAAAGMACGSRYRSP